MDKGGNRFRPHQQYFVGGNTKFYGAILFRLRERDFGEIRHRGGVSPAWPISYEDLAPYYDEAEALYHVHGERGEDPTEPPASGPYPWPAVSHEPRIQRLHEDLEGAGLNPFHLPVGVLLDESNPGQSNCVPRRQSLLGRSWNRRRRMDSRTRMMYPLPSARFVTSGTRSRSSTAMPAFPRKYGGEFWKHRCALRRTGTRTRSGPRIPAETESGC